jgi:hypothetical protein
MKQVRKTGTPATYFEGNFELRDNSNTNWASPIDFPTVFTAYGAGIKSGNWQSCTSINTPQYVIDNYFGGEVKNLNFIFELCFLLENITWNDVKSDRTKVEKLIKEANEYLNELPQLN